MSGLIERLQLALASPGLEPPIAGDLPEKQDCAAKTAAVLMAITRRIEPGILLTLRHENMRAHAGQISFPGGRVEPGEDMVSAALREAREEIALDPAFVEVIGALEPYRTITGYDVTPIVSLVPPDLPLEPCEQEVAELFEAPLAYLLDPLNQHRQTAIVNGVERHYYETVWNGRRIWGATAAMIVNLSRRLQWR